MAKTGNPFLDGDFKAFDNLKAFDMAAFFDPKNFADQWEKAIAPFQADSLNTQAVVKSQQKNLEVLASANQRVFEGLQTLARRQTEMARDSLENYTAAFSELAAIGDPQANLTKQSALMKSAYEAAVENYRELAEISRKSHDEAARLLSARASEILDELNALSAQGGAKPAPKSANHRAK